MSEGLNHGSAGHLLQQLFVVSKQANITEKFIDAANHQDTTKKKFFNRSIKLMRMIYSYQTFEGTVPTYFICPNPGHSLIYL